jgi:hypothetical protein
MMLDQNSSGNLNPMELRCALMAFAEMGVITESIGFQPMNESYSPWKENVYWYQKHASHPDKQTPFANCIGWDPDLVKADPARPKKKAHPLWQGRHQFIVKNPLTKTKGNAIITDYPIYTAPGTVLLVGVEGLPISRKPWVLSLEFQFDEPDAEAYVGAKKYSVLVSAYRNNAIVARNSGTMEKPGIQLLFIKQDAFVNAETLIQRCKEYEMEGVTPDLSQRDNMAQTLHRHQSAQPHDSNAFLSGLGTYSITPFIPMEQLRWYKILITGRKFPGVGAMTELTTMSCANLTFG